MQQLKVTQEVFGFIAALRTMLDNYPELRMNNNLLNILNSNNPLGFLLNLAEICGLSKEDLLNWVSKILCGAEVISTKGFEKTASDINKVGTIFDNKLSQGILDTIELGVKTILLANVKDMFTCSINPFIPMDILKYPISNKNDKTFIEGKGITIPLTTIDLFNVLQHHPNSTFGKNLYFDNNMSSNEYWQSTDYNVFLWYVINKGSNFKDEKLKKIWDNRVKHRERLTNSDNTILKNNFFNLYLGNGTYVDTNHVQNVNSFQTNQKKEKNDNTILKKQFILVDYNETDTILTTPNNITIWLNGDRYRYQALNENVFLNKTVFEFNYDYIYSLKLFDSKTIVSNIINSLLGITHSTAAAALDMKYSIEQQTIAGMVSKIVSQVLEDEDVIIDDCFFSFSNDEYDKMIKENELKFHNNYSFGNINGQTNKKDVENINDAINGIGDSITLIEQQSTIKNIFNNVIDITSAQNEDIIEHDKFTLGSSIIFDVLKESVTQIVLQVLSPKVMILYALNSYFMGDVTDGDFSKINIKNFLKGLTNLITKIVKMVLEMLISELLKEMLLRLKDLLNSMLRILVLERVEYYLELIKRLSALIDMFYRKTNDGNIKSFIDNVNYADIVPIQNNPKNETC